MKTENRSQKTELCFRFAAIIAACSLLLVACSLQPAFAAGSGTLESPAAVDAAGSRMYTLEGIYSRLHSGTTASKGSGFTEPSAGPADGVMYTLNDVLDDFNTDAGNCNATAADVLYGKTFFAATGTTRGTNWGPVSGTANTPPGSGTAATASQILTGYYAFNASGAALSGSASAGGLPKTGQTTQYSGKADDGYYQMGTARSYTVNTGAEAGTVTDNVTGLMWELKTNDGSLHDWDNTYIWTDAFDVFIAGLNAANFADHNDWRLPNAYELFSIALLEATNRAPYINQTVFGGTTGPTYYTKSSNYWSSTTIPYRTVYALYVNFTIGNVYIDDKTNRNCVRAVRGGQ